MSDTSMATWAPELRVGAQELKSWLRDGGEIAVLDVREHGRYGEAHLFFGVTAPYSRLELDARRLVPRLSTRVVVYDEGGAVGSQPAVAERAARRLRDMGYGAVFVLDGGAAGWADAGFGLFAGVNVPSKTFGELAELSFHTPRLSARDLAAKLEAQADLVVLDGRPVEEYRKMSIPTATCCPNGELALRAELLAPDPATTIVINCAGRTRSIIGAQNLIDMGIANPVFALENGTQGWYLDDLTLDHGADRLYPPPPPEAALPALRARARAFADRWAVPFVCAAELERFREDHDRTTYLFDVRTPEEYAAGSLPGAVNAPGGQLVQATDQYAATRGARMVLFDGEGVRAPVIAARMRQMGWDAQVLEEGVAAPLAPGADSARDVAPALALQPLEAVSVEALAALPPGAQLVDIRGSMAYRAGHLTGAVWSLRPLLVTLPLSSGAPVVLVAERTELAQLAARELLERGFSDVRVHLGTPAAWREAGLEVVATPDLPADEACIDFLFFVHDRHSGNKAAARQYLAWETNLLAQIDGDERASYRI
ncbi:MULTISPECIES: rhodanese-like domain-containing protein [unclassified Xanthobacter]|uniref:rhodanese-like domain-containing protein n=1 Tax=unclassified Xanthobacter TaxID=2623496 RepID=UPI001EDE63A4|nr:MULTISPECIES: rhodanese-like domain-containing protein [unclassified Xanthobacter]